MLLTNALSFFGQSVLQTSDIVEACFFMKNIPKINIWLSSKKLHIFVVDLLHEKLSWTSCIVWSVFKSQEPAESEKLRILVIYFWWGIVLLKYVDFYFNYFLP